MRKIILYLITTSLLLTGLSQSLATQQCCIGKAGNIDGDPFDDTNVADLTFLVSYLFDAGPQPPCLAEADVDASGEINVADLTYLVSYLFSAGPTPNDCPVVVADSVILPLAIGNQWITSVTEYNESGSITAQYNATGTVVGDTAFAGWTWYKLEADTSGSDTSLWTNKEDGAWSWTDSTGSPEALILMYPATPGQSYPIYDVTVTVESISAPITVPAGTFTCYYYRLHVPIFGTVGKVWVAPNIGIIRAEEYGLSLFGTYLAREVELLSYSLAQPTYGDLFLYLDL